MRGFGTKGLRGLEAPQPYFTTQAKEWLVPFAAGHVSCAALFVVALLIFAPAASTFGHYIRNVGYNMKGAAQLISDTVIHQRIPIPPRVTSAQRKEIQHFSDEGYELKKWLTENEQGIMVSIENAQECRARSSDLARRMKSSETVMAIKVGKKSQKFFESVAIGCAIAEQDLINQGK